MTEEELDRLERLVSIGLSHKHNIREAKKHLAKLECQAVKSISGSSSERLTIAFDDGEIYLYSDRFLPYLVVAIQTELARDIKAEQEAFDDLNVGRSEG